MSQAMKIAREFVAACEREGFAFEAHDKIVSVAKRFTPGDNDAFAACDMVAPSLLNMLNARGGSRWGTDGGSVGGYSALKRGTFVLNQSGVPKRVVTALRHMLADAAPDKN